ncbi:hypothetical protein [Actinomadura gamaensis]|uniref:Uncharacterized protein n=1 Tax=Actinomadura gamaensis TaxID=1763541 RepID=A0ABV9TTU8_9ACTN
MRLSGVLVNAARHDWLTLENHLADRLIDHTAIVAPPPALRNGVRRRTIYESRCAEHSVVAENIPSAAASGEEARPLAGVGTTGAVLARSPVIVAALCEYFELLRERAMPIGAAQADSPNERGC